MTLDFRSWAASALEDLRAKGPLIHHIANLVTLNDSANAVLSLGALPIMAHALEEVPHITKKAGALVLNTGTPTPESFQAMLAAGRCANDLGIPVILDPVGVGSSPLRREGVASLLENLTLAAIRGNLAEIQFIVQGKGDLVGVEAKGDLDLTGRIALAREGARSLRTVLAITGSWDVVASSKQTFIVQNGHPLMQRVTGTGCMATSVLAAFLALEQGPLPAAAALAFYGLAGERAAQRAKGPGSLKTALFDELYNLAPEDAKECRVERRD